MEQLRQDVRYGLRKLWQQPGFAAAAIAVLALGIGATATIFSAVDAVLLRPLPFAQGDRLVRIDELYIPMRSSGEEERPQTQPHIGDLATLEEVFTSYAAYAPGGLNLSGAGSPMRVDIAMVTPSFFPTLGVFPELGRPFTQAEGSPDGPRRAILSQGLWHRHFGADRGVIGEDIALNGVDYQVVGVMPEGFAFPENAEVWLPLPVPMTFAHWEPFRQYMPSSIIGRLAPGMTVEQAGERVRSLFVAYATPERPAEVTAAELVMPLRETLVGDNRTALLVLLGATALVLLIACANVANLLLSRAATRRHEFAVRSVLGATSGRMLRQLMIESLILAVIGGVLGVLLAFVSLGALGALIPASLAGAAPLRIDGRVLLFTAGIVLLSGLTFGLWPALGARRAGGEALKSGGSGRATSGEQARLRRIFVVGEIGLALMLLVGAGVMLRSFQALLATDAGLEPERVVTLEMSLGKAPYPTPVARRELIQEVLARLEPNARIEAAAFINHLPLKEGSVRFSVLAEGSPPPESFDEMIMAQDLRVTPGYFRTMGIPILRGRTLSAMPDSLAPEILVNEALAELLWPGEEAVGKYTAGMFGGPPHEVVGVVGNVLPSSLESEIIAQMYNSLLATPYDNLALVARGRVSSNVLISWLQQVIRAVAPEQAVYNVRTMEQVISGTVAPRRTNTLLVTVFGALAVVLASVGVYGVIAYGVTHRTREIGIRMALGARPRDVMLTFMREGVVLAAVGTALGLFGAWGLTRVLASLVYGVSPRDPVAFIVAPVVLLAIVAVATFLPARRATFVDPAEALRAE